MFNWEATPSTSTAGPWLEREGLADAGFGKVGGAIDDDRVVVKAGRHGSRREGPEAIWLLPMSASSPL